MNTYSNRSALLGAFVLGGCAAIVLLFSPDLAAQCEMCRTALTQSVEGQRWSRGLNAGILLLVAAPFLIAASALLVIYQAQVRHSLRKIRLLSAEAYRKTALTVPPLNLR